MNTEKLRSLIRESIQDYIKEIDSAGTTAMYEAKRKACDDAIEKRKKKIEMAESLEEMQGMFDENKINELKKEMKMLEKQKAKYGKMLEKMNKGKEVVTEEPTEALVDETDVMAEMDIVDEISLSENEGEERYDEDGNIDPNGMYDVGGNYIGATDTARDKAEYDKDLMNESFLKMQKLAGVITEAQYNQKKKALNENEITNSPVVQKLEKKAFDFFNQPKVAALLKKELDKLSPEKKAELAKMTMQEGEGNDFSSFKSAVEKGIDKASLNEDMHDTLRGIAGYKKGEEASAVDKAAGKVLTNLGVANIMSMGFLPALSAMALDYFGGTDVVNTVSQVVGDGGVAAALSVVAGLVGGGILWKLGKIMQNEKTSGNTSLFN